MSSPVETIKLIFVEQFSANSNKYWYAELLPDGAVISRWGRVGGRENRTDYPPARGGKRFFDKKIKEKKKKGYTELKLAGDNTKTQVVSNPDLYKIAAAQIKTSGDPILDKLVERLVNENIHVITSATNITYNSQSGLFQTPLGVVTNEAIDDARALLGKIAPFVEEESYNSRIFQKSINSYFRLIPQDIGMGKFRPLSFFAGDNAIKKQLDILDSLEASYKAISSPDSVDSDEEDDAALESVFDLSLRVAEGDEFERIRKKYHETLNKAHKCKHLDLKRAYVVSIPSMILSCRQEDARLGNMRELWHGTKTANLLSILKGGLQCSPPSTAKISGKMYGNGLYFSDQSTKSLNYAYGYWSGTTQDHCFMFLADVVMGKPYMATRGWGSYPKPDYDSTFAEAGRAGVLNNEMIIYKKTQCNLTFLCEFTPQGK
jgi:poly [ADP-ribose] polymerase